MAGDPNAEEPETCPLCVDTGPPKATTAASVDAGPSTLEDDAGTPDLQWIACSKCNTWMHSVCIIQSPNFKDASIPQQLRDEIASSGENEWYDWAKRVDRWYCQSCIDLSSLPDNPRPPRRPMSTTLKRQRKPKRSSSGPADSPGAKRARQSSSIADNATPAPNGDAPVTEGRPKRQAAIDRPDYLNMHNHVPTPTKNWIDLIKDPAKYGRVIKTDQFPRVPGSMLRKEWIESSGVATDSTGGFPNSLHPTLFYGPTREPLVVRPQDGGLASMGGRVPDPSLTVEDVARLVGPQRMCDVIDVATQHSSQWPLSKWAAYVKARSDPNAASSSKVYNIISLEISGTDLAKDVQPPSIVSDIDWVENFWPFPGGKEATMRSAAKEAGGELPVSAEQTPKGKAKSEWPKVQLYCLMGMKDAWTDWHVDFAASSVYYHIHTGSKVFFFIRPTEANLAAYAQWSGSWDLQQSTWLPDMCDEVRKVTLSAGDTMIIPAGYIHSVFTPVDSIVFGGNFVHSYDIPTQLRMRQVEIDTKVPQRFRFPFFDRLCWYVAERYTADLRQLRSYRPNSKAPTAQLPHERVLRGLMTLATFLIDQVDKMEDTTAEDKTRKLIWNRIPTDVQDPGALAHELYWRVERELPDLWEDEDEVKVGGHGKKKRKRAAPNVKSSAKAMQLLDKPSASRVWQFSPSPWEQDEHPISKTTKTVSLPRPGGTHPEDAEEVIAVYRQGRSRTRKESTEIVQEDQDIVFTERRVTWPVAPTAAVPNSSEPPTVEGGVKAEGASSEWTSTSIVDQP